MKNILLVIFTLLLTILTGTTFSVEKKNVQESIGKCASDIPSYDWEMQFQKLIAKNQSSRQAATTYSIPVIVHIIYWTNNTTQNISAAQVQSQITILNNDYAGTGLNASSLPTPFKALVANTGITFCLAKIDQNGTVLAEPGIERIKASTKGFTNPGASGWAKDYIDGTIKPATIWNPNYYLNIWVVPGIAGGTAGSIILGYAVFPTATGLTGLPETSTEFTDGFACRSTYFGNVGSASGTNGRTATHEIGHWLGLRHISGDAVCGDDFVADTPTQKGGNAGGPPGLNYGCPTYPFQVNGCGAGTSPNGELFQDFMDYTDDDCMALFTNGQNTRIQTALQNGDFRKNLIHSTMCDTARPPADANFSFALQSSALCATSQTYNFTDKSLFTPTSWSWTFAGGTPSTSSIKSPTGIVFNTAGQHNVTLTVSNAKGGNSITKTVTVSIIGTGTMPFSEGFEGTTFPPVGWNLVNRNGNPAINWDSSRTVGGFGTSTACMRYDNTTLDGNHAKDDIVTPKLDLTGLTTAKLKFDVAYAPYHDSTQDIYDTLVVLLTGDCGTTTTQIYSKGGNTLKTAPGQGVEFYPTAAQWRKDSIAIPVAFQKANVQVIFRNLGNYGHTIYVDNVNVATPTSSPTATASFTASDTVLCPGGSLTFTNTSTATSGSPDSVRWTIPGGTPSTSNSTTTVSPVFSTTGTYVISLTAYKSGILSAAVTKSIRVKALPTVGVNSPTICSGTSATLTATGNASSFTWSGGLSSGNPTSTGPLTGNATYTVTGTLNGCTNTAVSTVTVTALPTVGVTASTSICNGDSITLTATGATTYTWQPSGSGASIKVAPSGTTTYTVTGTTNGCSNTAATTITVKSKPTVGVNSPTICSGTSATLTATGNATSFTWSGGLAAGNPASTGPLTGNATYTVTGTLNGCTNTAVSTVTVNALPSVAVNSPSICSGGTATLTATGANTYVWSTSATGPSINVSPSATTTYTVTGTSTATTCSKTVTATVTVNNSAPTVTITPSPASVCNGDAVVLTANGANTYIWDHAGTTTTNTLTFVPTGAVTVGVSGTVTGCTAAGTASVNVTVKPKPTVGVNSPSVCSGTPATLTATGADSYVWSTTATGPSISVSPSGTTTYTVTGTTNGCTGTANSTVTVKPLPNTTLNASDNSVCSGDPVTLTASGATTYVWAPGGSGTSQVINPTSTVTYTVTGTTDGCDKSASQTITVSSVPATPAITQSGDTLYSSVIVAGATYNWYLNGSVTPAASTLTPYYKITTGGVYTVQVVKGNCESITSANFNAVLTGVKNNNKIDVSFAIVPNPNNGDFEIKMYSVSNKKYSLILYNLTGQVIIKEEMNVRAGANLKRIDLSGIEKGSYILSIIGEDGIATQNIIVQ